MTEHPPFEDPQIIDTRPSDKRDLVLWGPSQIAGCDPIKWNALRPNLVSDFQAALEAATDEKPLQAFFEQHPAALLSGIVSPHTAWVIPRPRWPKPNGDFWIPDFVVCDWTSVGPDWFIVELESPRRTPLTQGGDVSQICNHAAGQINSYRRHIDEHGHFLRGEGWPKLHGKAEGVIVIGRRDDPLRLLHPDRLSDFKAQNISVMSYDRLLDSCTHFESMIELWHESTRKLLAEPHDD